MPRTRLHCAPLGPALTRRALLPLGLALLLPGCGFQPLYGAGPGGVPSEAQADLAAITVGLIPDRSGQLLRQALQDRFERQGVGAAHRYDLAVAYSIGQEGIGIQPDTSTTYVRVTGNASWILRAQDPQHTTVTTGSARAFDSYNYIANQFFAADLEFETIQRRLADGLADRITLQLATYFKRHPVKT
jgi:LPS-assembly lipoprotein